MKYIKKPAVVEAFQVGVDSYPDWYIDELMLDNIIVDPYDYTYACKIKTLEGTMTAHKGDMIIKGIKGEIYPCKKDIFDAYYDVYEENEGCPL